MQTLSVRHLLVSVRNKKMGTIVLDLTKLSYSMVGDGETRILGQMG